MRRPGVLVPVGVAAGVHRRVGRQQALAGDVVDLEPDAVGILEHEEVVAGRPVALDWPAIDVAAELAHLGRRLVDILAGARAHAEVVQAYPVLLEASAFVLGRAALDADRGTAADVIEEVVAVVDLLQPEERQQPAIEGVCLLPLTDGQDHVCHAVDFDHFPSFPAVRLI